MKKAILLFSLTLFAVGGFPGTANPTERTTAPSAQTAPDNMGRNARYCGGATLAPGDQSESEADHTLTQQLRKAEVADNLLSTMAKNIKVITIDGGCYVPRPSAESSRERELRRKPKKSRV
jgi:hypothetical protein